MALLRTNNCYFVGTLVEVKDHKELTYGPENKEAVAATIVLKCVLGEGDNATESVVELRNFTSKLTKDGKINKNYDKIVNINDLLGKRVVIAGAQINGERFWATNTSQLVNSIKFNFNMIRAAKADETEDKAEFEYAGFVYKELYERTDADGNVQHYVISIAQANYHENNMQVVDFVVDKNNIAAVKAIQQYYTQGATVSISGVCSNIVTQTTKTEEAMFGDPIVKVFTKTDKKLILVSGKPVIEGEGEYSVEAIKTLVDAYTKEGIEIKNKSTNDSNVQTAQTATKSAPSKKSALAGLI